MRRSPVYPTSVPEEGNIMRLSEEDAQAFLAALGKSARVPNARSQRDYVVVMRA